MDSRKYVKISFNCNSVCMGDDCNPHNEYIKFVADKTTMLDIVNRLGDEVTFEDLKYYLAELVINKYQGNYERLKFK